MSSQSLSFAMQTLSELHHNAHLAHLNISLESVVLQHSSLLPWDSLRLLDFRFAHCDTGEHLIKAIRLAVSQQPINTCPQSRMQ